MPKKATVRNASWIALALVFGMSAIARCEDPDRHMTDAVSRVLYERSAYAHGYMHGYEEGFHSADMDIHMGRGERSVRQIQEYADCKGYRSEFGDKKFFRTGYQKGFEQGYGDGIQGRAFRALAQIRKIAEGLSVAAAKGFRERDFDTAFSRGYDAGRRLGTTPVTMVTESEPRLNLCQSNMPRSVKDTADFCDAFDRGLSLGFSDAEADRATPRTETARK